MKKKWLLMVVALAMSASMASCDLFTSASSTPDSTESVQSSVTESTPEESTPEESTPTESSPTESTPEESSPEDSSPEDSSPEDSSPEDSSPEDGGDEGDGPVVETYLVKFVDSEGNVISEAWLEEGEMPEAPTNVAVPDNTEFVTYTGAWDKEIAEVSGAVTYTWVITESKVMVTVTFNGVEMETPKGETVTAPSIKEAGKVLTGWTVNGETVDFDTYIVMDAVDFVPVWTAIPYATSGDTYMNAVEWDEGANWYYEIGSQAEVKEWDVNLPVMAYPEGKTVTYNWIGGAWILVGIGGNYVQGQGVGSQGTISITNVGGVLMITIENTANPASITAKYTDADIVAGNKPLTIKVDNGAQYNHFFISKEPTVTDSVIQTNIFDKTAIYNSAGTEFAPASTSDTGATYTVGADYGMGLISLPKIDFTKYTKVTFDWSTSEWIQFGWSEHLWFYDAATPLKGTATITYHDGYVWMTVECNGVVQPQGWDLYFSSVDVHTGKEAIMLGYKNESTWMSQSITISNFTLGELPPVATYTVKFVDENGNVLSEQTVEEGKMPEIPTNVTTPENTDTMTYTGAWDKEVVAVTGDVTYTWVVTATEVKPANIFDTTFGNATNGGKFAPSNTSDTGASYGVNETQGMGTITLPKVDYTKYTTVTFNWATSGWIQFGWDVHLWYYDNGTALNGTATITYLDGKVYMVFESNGVVQPGWELSFSSEDIHTGKEALSLGYNCTAGWQSITISNFTMTEKPAEPEVPAEPAAPYTFEGAATWAGDAKQADASIDGTTVHFSSVMNATFSTLQLAKVDFTKYSQVTFNVSSSDWILVGYGSDLWYACTGAGLKEATVTMIYANGKITFTMASGDKSYSASITDEDIINGKKAFAINAQGYADHQWVKVTDFAVAEAPAAPAYSFEGAATWAGDAKQADASIDGTTVQFNTIMNGVRATLTVAKVDFTKYTTVTFNWNIDDWMMFGYGSDLWFSQTGGGSASGTATMTYADGVITFTFVSGDNTYKATITDADVINGKKAFTLSAQGHADYRNVRITNFAVAEAPAAPTFTFEGTGVFDGSGNMLAAANVTETGATYDAPDNVDVYVAIPKIDFTKVSKVTFDWQDGGWTKLGSATTYYSENKADPSVSGSVEIVNNGDGTLTLTFNYGAKTKTETITDADVINGTKAYTLKIKDYGYKILTISNFTVVA